MLPHLNDKGETGGKREYPFFTVMNKREICGGLALVGGLVFMSAVETPNGGINWAAMLICIACMGVAVVCSQSRKAL